MIAEPSITCPICGHTSHHPDDVRHGYCGQCHAFTRSCTVADCGRAGALVAGNVAVCRHHAKELAMTDPRLSDEATGLPPLEHIDPDNTVLVLAWDASEGIAASPVTREPQAVRYLHARGLALGRDEGAAPDWVQVFLAVPVEAAVDVAAALAKGTAENLGDDR